MENKLEVLLYGPERLTMIKLNEDSVYIIRGQYLYVGARFKRCFKDNELILDIIKCPNARTFRYKCTK